VKLKKSKYVDFVVVPRVAGGISNRVASGSGRKVSFGWGQK